MNPFKVGATIASLSCMLFHGAANAELDLRNASRTRLDNGLTVILLEDRNFPVVSVQSLYRVGARNETTGQTGLAHFLEHMAFRATESFPDTGVVSEIYARGGEWHGYTWTDQTTYFATVPKEHVDLLLHIEADRLARLTIDADDMQAEQGAVLAEMHGYENDPATVLFDAVLFSSFLGHPYRNNTIGWESDIENLSHENVVDFYERHYVPANAVLAIVGDFDSAAVSRRVEELFAKIEAGPATPLPHTIEPPQNGVRRVRLLGPADKKHFRIAWRAPSAASPDYAAFLVLQDWLGGSSGVSFLQNDWGTAVREDSLLYGSAEELTSWFPPSAQDYVFLISGTATADADEEAIEAEIDTRIGLARDSAPDSGTLAESVDRILDELVFDVETTEDAAHQLAFFEGLGALDTLLQLPDRLRTVRPEDLQAVAGKYLRPEQRTIGWYVPGESVSNSDAALPAREVAQNPAESPVDTLPVAEPAVSRLANGIPVVVAASDFSAAAHLRIVLPNSADNAPALGHTSLGYRFRSSKATEIVRRSAQALADLEDLHDDSPSSDPAARLEQALAGIMGAPKRPVSGTPSVIVVAGDVHAEETIALLDDSFGRLSPSVLQATTRRKKSIPAIDISMGRPLAQAQLGYSVPAPSPRDPDSYAWRLMLYILSHHYEGRLGKKAISDRGLVYYIDSRYRSDGDTAWITMATGVDPQKLETMTELLKSELRRLADEPPSDAEIAEARNHLVGRARSAAQSNEELTASLATQWIWFGRLQSPDELRQQLDEISDDQVRAVAKQFARGTITTVRE